MESSTMDFQMIQELERELLREVIRICQKNEIHYFLIEGSMLGAVRHQGMIPWDDDIDIGMFREDYEHFLRVAPDELNALFELKSYRTDKDYIECITKVVNKKRFVRSFAKKEPFVTNVWIDVFVIDGMPEGKLKQKLHKARLLATKLMLMCSNVEHYALPRKRPFHEKMFIWIAKNFYLSKVLRTDVWLKRLDKAMASIPVTQDGDTVIFTSEYRFRTHVPISVYGSGRETSFDGIPAIIPTQAEKFLAQIYGDYMQFPPEQDRYKHRLELLSE